MRRGEVADDDVTFDIYQTRTGQTTIGAHGQYDGIGFVVDRNPNQAGPLLDAVVAHVAVKLAAAIEGNVIFAEVESGDSGGGFINASENYTGYTRSQQGFLHVGTKAD